MAGGRVSGAGLIRSDGAGNVSADVGGTQGANIASASTTNLATATGDYVDVTGSVTITALGSAAAGTVRRVRFTGAPLITYNSGTLILPGNASIQAASGDTAEFVSLGSGNWKCTRYTRDANAPFFLGALQGVYGAMLKAAGTALTSATLADVAGLSAPLLANHFYTWSCRFRFLSDTLTSGLKLAFNAPTGSKTATVRIPQAADGTAHYFAGISNAVDDAVTSTDVPATASAMIAEMEGILMPTADGTLQIRAANEAGAGNVTPQQATSLIVWDWGT